MANFCFKHLSPTAFLDRSSDVFGDVTAVVDGDTRFTYREFSLRCQKLSGALMAMGIQPGDRVAALCSNSHVMLELHNGVPYAGGVLVPLNVRLSNDELMYIIDHAGAKLLIATVEHAEQAESIGTAVGVRTLIASGQGSPYEKLLASSSREKLTCEDELGLLAISYTSGTTGRPKGVMYHHRGAYLQAVAMAYHARMNASTRYLWTLPQFHCNGWCFTWAVTAAGGTHVCLRSFEPGAAWHLIRTEGVTHLSAAPTVLSMIANWADTGHTTDDSKILVQTGGAPPSPALLTRLVELGMEVTHLYGLTETYGPAVISEWLPEWDNEPTSNQAWLRARQGVANIVTDRLRVITSSGEDVSPDGSSLGELALRGNTVMLGYYRDPGATEAAVRDGWFRTGDIGVVHPDGYIEIRDRLKDVIISGGENISSVEVERVLDSHPKIMESAVVAAPDDHWGEVPIAFVTPISDSTVSEGEVVAYTRDRLAHFKVPKRVLFGPLPKTATGKIQKHVLREKAHREASGQRGRGLEATEPEV